MPNWVRNALSITGENETLTSVRAALAENDETPITFQKLIPRPAEKEKSWYEWNIAHWDTKWDACQPSCEQTPGNLRFTFDTAWSPPLVVIDALIEKFPNLSFTFEYEEEQGWGGLMSVEAGTITAHDTYEIPSSHQELSERGRHCYCETADEAFFDDCFTYRAAQIDGVSDETIEAVKGIQCEWHGTFEELLEAARIL